MAKKARKRNPTVYALVLVLVVVVIAVAFLALQSSTKKNEQSAFRIFNNLSNSSLNRTQLIFLNDLEKSINLTRNYGPNPSQGVHVTYYEQNATVLQSGLDVNSNMTIDSYQM